MWWALGVVVVIAVGLPLTVGLATRGLGRRPPRPVKPDYGKNGQWLYERYGLDWRASARVESAVARGERVGDPALEDATIGLAALIVSGRAPGQRLLRSVGLSGMALGAAVLIAGIVEVGLNHSASHWPFFLWYGPLLILQAWAQTIWRSRIERRKAAAAMELNRPAATARLSFRAEDRQGKGGARDSGDGGDRQRRR